MSLILFERAFTKRTTTSGFEPQQVKSKQQRIDEEHGSGSVEGCSKAHVGVISRQLISSQCLQCWNSQYLINLTRPSCTFGKEKSHMNINGERSQLDTCFITSFKSTSDETDSSSHHPANIHPSSACCWPGSPPAKKMPTAEMREFGYFTLKTNFK